MLRLIFFFAVLVLLAVVSTQIFRAAKTSNLDWTGIAFGVGFVALAFYLRHVTHFG